MGAFQLVFGSLALLVLGFNVCRGIRICRCMNKASSSKASSVSERLTDGDETTRSSMLEWIQRVNFLRGYTPLHLKSSRRHGRNQWIKRRDYIGHNQPTKKICIRKFSSGGVQKQGRAHAGGSSVLALTQMIWRKKWRAWLLKIQNLRGTAGFQKRRPKRGGNMSSLI